MSRASLTISVCNICVFVQSNVDFNFGCDTDLEQIDLGLDILMQADAGDFSRIVFCDAHWSCCRQG